MPTKKNPYASPTEKVISLFGILLFSGRKHSLAQLATLLDCSKQTVLRAIEQLQATRQIEVEQWVEGKEKWYKAKSPRKKPDITLDVEAIQHLQLCRNFVWHLLPHRLRDEVSRTISHTTVLLPDFDERQEALQSIGFSQVKGAIDYSGKQDVIEAILTGCRKRRFCEVSYRAASSSCAKNLLVAPLKVVAYREGLFVRCRLAKAFKEPEKKYFDPLLAVHRMSRATLTNETFKYQESKSDPHVTTFGMMLGEPFRVRIQFGRKAASYVSERTWSDDQQVSSGDDGGLTLEFTATSRPEVISWVLGFGADANLIAPEDLRQEISAAITAMQGHYGAKSQK